jgi:hypothetical protein
MRQLHAIGHRFSSWCQFAIAMFLLTHPTTVYSRVVRQNEGRNGSARPTSEGGQKTYQGRKLSANCSPAIEWRTGRRRGLTLSEVLA